MFLEWCRSIGRHVHHHWMHKSLAAAVCCEGVILLSLVRRWQKSARKTKVCHRDKGPLKKAHRKYTCQENSVKINTFLFCQRVECLKNLCTTCSLFLFGKKFNQNALFNQMSILFWLAYKNVCQAQVHFLMKYVWLHRSKGGVRGGSDSHCFLAFWRTRNT